MGHSRAQARLKEHCRDGSSRDALDPLPDKGEETQGSQDAIERDVGEEVAQVVADGPGQVLGGERKHQASLCPSQVTCPCWGCWEHCVIPACPLASLCAPVSSQTP